MSVKLTVVVSENGLKREELLCDLRQLHNEELCDLHWSPTIVTMIKLRGMRWVGHVACILEKSVFRFLVWKPVGPTAWKT